MKAGADSLLRRPPPGPHQVRKRSRERLRDLLPSAAQEPVRSGGGGLIRLRNCRVDMNSR